MFFFLSVIRRHDRGGKLRLSDDRRGGVFRRFGRISLASKDQHQNNDQEGDRRQKTDHQDNISDLLFALLLRALTAAPQFVFLLQSGLSQGKLGGTAAALAGGTVITDTCVRGRSRRNSSRRGGGKHRVDLGKNRPSFAPRFPALSPKEHCRTDPTLFDPIGDHLFRDRTVILLFPAVEIPLCRRGVGLRCLDRRTHRRGNDSRGLIVQSGNVGGRSRILRLGIGRGLMLVGRFARTLKRNLNTGTTLGTVTGFSRQLGLHVKLVSLGTVEPNTHLESPRALGSAVSDEALLPK